jgi:hypothetical protein
MLSGAPSFDADFAESMSKPLPDWYVLEKEEREQFIEELEAQREKIMAAFEEKYGRNNLKDLQSLNLEESKEQQAKAARAQAAKKPTGWLQKAAAAVGLASTGVEESEEEDIDLKEARENTDFYLPGLLEVFPELKNFKWPVWAKKRDGGLVKCETDRDCQVPQACCPHPIIPGDKFCCTGWGTRIMDKQYVGQEVVSNRDENYNKRGEKPPGNGGFGDWKGYDSF